MCGRILSGDRGGGGGGEFIFIPRSSETKGGTVFESVLFGELVRNVGTSYVRV